VSDGCVGGASGKYPAQAGRSGAGPPAPVPRGVGVALAPLAPPGRGSCARASCSRLLQAECAATRSSEQRGRGLGCRIAAAGSATSGRRRGCQATTVTTEADAWAPACCARRAVSTLLPVQNEAVLDGPFERPCPWKASAGVTLDQSGTARVAWIEDLGARTGPVNNRPWCVAPPPRHHARTQADLVLLARPAERLPDQLSQSLGHRSL
jgi:hypothetical protein